MHVLIAPNAFKGALDAEAASRAIETGLKQSGLGCTTECFPIADGGDGTCELLLRRFEGEQVTVCVTDPLGRPVSATYGLIEDGYTAVIEMANASGLRLLKRKELNPLGALSTGTGELINHALDRNVRRVIITMGGSATVDGGIGIMKALGARFFGKGDKELEDLPGSLSGLYRVDLTQSDKRLNGCEIIVLCDVHNLLLGQEGAAAVFGPQKGASPSQVQILDEGLRTLSKVVAKQTGRDMSTVEYGGTAGGASAGLFAMANARLVNGINYFLDITNFDEALRRSALLITAEGRIDEQTLQGKGPFGVAIRAKQLGIPVVAFAGQVPVLYDENLQRTFDVLLPIGNGPSDLASAMQNTNLNLIRIAGVLGRMLCLPRH